MSEVVTIDVLGARGDGVTADGLFVPGALPGEQVSVHRTGHRAQIDALLERSIHRVSAPCRHAGSCGGCALQHASDEFIAEWKAELIARALAARGLNGITIRPTTTSPPASRRRVTFSGRRTKKSVLIGLHADSSDQIVPIHACEVARPEIVAGMPVVERIIAVGASRKGALRLLVTLSTAGLDVAVAGGKPLEGGLYGELISAAATGNLARLSWDGEVVVTRREPVQRFGSAVVVPPPGSFLQATEEGQETLVDAVLQATNGARRIADLFAGVGTFTLPLAQTAEVHAVEADGAPLRALDRAWRHTEGMRKVSAETRDLFRRPLRPADFASFDAAVFDPPRAGARAQAEQLASSPLPRIAAVSCNPATFARDARLLVDGGYRLDWVLPVDQFRWTPHVELVAAFSRP
ncbi:MAG: class I SAM-dependent RNA methyltransferase [Pseudomonadota bacterium]